MEEKNQKKNIFLETLFFIFSLIKKFISAFLKSTRLLGFKYGLFIIAIFVLSLYFSYQIGFENGNSQAIRDLTTKYNISEQKLYELLDIVKK